MKTTNQRRNGARWAALLIAGASVCAGLAWGAADRADPATGELTIRGEVTSLTDDTLTLNDSEIVFLTPWTTCTVDENASMLSDLAVGERARITYFRDAQTGDRFAEAIDVRR